VNAQRQEATNPASILSEPRHEHRRPTTGKRKDGPIWLGNLHAATVKAARRGLIEAKEKSADGEMPSAD
jgi:hypothetical protein